MEGHQGSVFCAQFTFDGDYLVSGAEDNTLRLWDVDSGVTLRVFQGHQGVIRDLVVEGKNVFSASSDGTVKRWLIHSPHLKINDELAHKPFANAIAADGSVVAVGSEDGVLQLFALSDVEHVLWKKVAHAGSIRHIAFSHDSRLLATASSDNTVKLWQVNDKELQERQQITIHTDKVSAVVFSSDDKLLATASYDGQVGLFTLVNGTAEQLDIKAKAHDGADVNSVDFGAKQLLTAGDDGVRIWTITAQGLDESPQFIVGEKGDITLWAAFSADGQYFASGSKNKSTVTVYQKVSQAGVESFKEVNLLYGHKNSTQRGIFGPCGQQLVTVSGDATLRFWDLSGELAGKAELLTLHLPVRAFPPAPLWSFDFQCTPKGCWIAVPLLTGKLVIYELGSIYNCSP